MAPVTIPKPTQRGKPMAFPIMLIPGPLTVRTSVNRFHDHLPALTLLRTHHALSHNRRELSGPKHIPSPSKPFQAPPTSLPLQSKMFARFQTCRSRGYHLVDLETKSGKIENPCTSLHQFLSNGVMLHMTSNII